MRDDWKEFEGQVFNKFPLQRFLGSTSSTAVFLTQSPPPEQKGIAIKLINPAKVEFQLSVLLRASKLNHPNLLRLLPGGCSQLGGMNLVFVVMEYAEKNLGQGLPDRPLSENEASEMLRPLLDALTYIHSKGFAHSHIKPSNIMAVGDQLKLSSDTVLPVGEPRPTYRPLDVYAAPEAGSAPVAPSSDVWSLGVTLVELLTQQAPVSSPESQADPTVPSTIPQPFLDIAQHCLRRDPGLRWTTAQIADCLNSAPVQVTAPAVTVDEEEKLEPSKEHPAPVQVAASAAAASEETKAEPPKEMWVDSDYCWVVVCKNHGFHGRGNFFSAHRIPLGETDAVLPRPAIDKAFRVRCDECGKEYTYQPSDVLKYEMEVPASFVVHPLFRNSLEPGKTDKYESIESPQPSSKKRLVRNLERVAGIASILLIVAEFSLTNLPKLSADVTGSLRPNDLMGAMFNLSNKGLLPVYDVKAGCKVMRVDAPLSTNKDFAEPTTVYFPESYAGILSPGHDMAVPCGRAIASKQDNPPEMHAEVFFVVTYRPKWVWWHKSENFPMETKKTDNGMWTWKSIPR
jgi:Protein kinase domain